MAKTRSKRAVGFALQEDDLYLGKIEELANEKLKKLKTTKDSKSKKVVAKKVIVSNKATKRLNEFVTNEMNGWDMKLVIQKFLFGSDLCDIQNRLNIPIKQLETRDFLTTDERQYLLSDRKHEMKVGVLGPRLRMFEEKMGLKIWNMTKTKNCVLKGKYWNKFVSDNKDDLKVNTLIQVWSFRKENNDLCLAIACVERPDDDVS